MGESGAGKVIRLIAELNLITKLHSIRLPCLMRWPNELALASLREIDLSTDTNYHATLPLKQDMSNRWIFIWPRRVRIARSFRLRKTDFFIFSCA
jgi:hypothetical protein